MSTRYHTPGSIWIEIALWIIFFPVGIIYSLWRWTSRKPIVSHPTADPRVFTHYTYDGQPPAHAGEGHLWYDMRVTPYPVVYVMHNGQWKKLGER